MVQLRVDLITLKWEKKISEEGPLANRMRPLNLEQFVGQTHLLGEGKPLKLMLLNDKLSSLLFYGPPGTGKTSLARIMAARSKAGFIQLNAVTAGVKDVRQVIDQARENWALHNRRTIMFIDEIHRFNKAQQDVLLSAIEQGTVIFFGATTENPFFYLNGPLLSRIRLYIFEPLTKAEIITLIKLVLKDQERGLGALTVRVDDEALAFVADRANGDARAALNALETAVMIGNRHNEVIEVTIEHAAEAMQKRLLSYDRQGDSHYDMASALIKSIRGSDPDAALYWMARMLKGGEDPLFIARRLVISAAEDIGNANPHALSLAMAAFQAVQMIGLPEGRIPLAQAVTYLAGSPKSNASYLAVNAALDLVENEENHPVPKHLRDSSYRGAKKMEHGSGYSYPHDYPGHYVEQEYLPPAMAGKKLYSPTEQGAEAIIRRYLDQINHYRRKGRAEKEQEQTDA
jgi:putative ATPase